MVDPVISDFVLFDMNLARSHNFSCGPEEGFCIIITVLLMYHDSLGEPIAFARQ